MFPSLLDMAIHGGIIIVIALFWIEVLWERQHIAPVIEHLRWRCLSYTPYNDAVYQLNFMGL